MKTRFICLALAAIAMFGFKSHAGLEHMTPKPAQMTIGTSSLALTPGFTIGYEASLPEEMIAEITKFTASLAESTNLAPTAAQGNGLIAVTIDATQPAEGYELNVTASGATIKASTATGLFYAFQTVKKLMPVNVAAGVAGAPDATYSIPAVAIADAPRFEYRGFMLDVSRHFFDAAFVKKMIDMMAIYKLNRFHWHLTDDQGWRLPVAKYPKLTVEGATNKNILLTDFADGVKENQSQTRAGENVIYGPYAYTADEIRDIVAYAKARHIEVIPEIDMPGHMVAAIHAYPEFSVDPENKLGIHEDLSHEIWNKGGVSRDVLDVSNPKAMQFVKDVVDVLADLFPYEYIHIGGDECPTLAWEHSESCQQFMQEKGLSTVRAIQSWFVQEIANYAKETHGRKIMGWNEIITEGGTDMNKIKEINPVVFCWLGGEQLAQNNGLDYVYTPFNGGYYINRSYAGFDRVGAVNDGALSVTLTVNPPLHDHCIGVQGTFWTEQVDRPTDVEYLALPRLIGIAEQGWSPAGKDYEEVMGRMVADAELLDLAGYNYGAHQLVMPVYEKPQPDTWYTISSNATDERAGTVIEVLAPDHAYVTDKAGNGAKAYRIWGCQPVAERHQQQFMFVEDPDNAGHYAIVCRAYPDGSVSSTPTGTSTADRWDYNASGLDYGFVLDKAYYAEQNNTFRYAIRPANLEGFYMNFARSGQGQAINVYNNPNDGKGGQLVFNEVTEVIIPEPGDVPSAGVYYRFHTRFNGDSSQPRYGSVIELLRDNADKGNNAQADRLWSNAPARKADENYDYQWFTFEPDPAGSQYYALVCKAKPEGSVNCTPSIANNAATARWDYDNENKHYGFYLVDNVNGNSVQGIDEQGFYSAMTSKDAASGWYMNISAAPQGYSVHLYSNPADQQAGIFTFEIDPASISGISSVAPAESSSASVIYDLQGRRLNAPARGINIINGRKVFIR